MRESTSTKGFSLSAMVRCLPLVLVSAGLFFLQTAKAEHSNPIPLEGRGTFHPGVAVETVQDTCPTYRTGSAPGHSAIAVFTPNDCRVSDALRYDGTDTTWTQQDLAEWWANNVDPGWTSVTLVAADKFGYNCHGYAWDKAWGGSDDAVLSSSIPPYANYRLYQDDTYPATDSSTAPGDGSFVEVDYEKCAQVVDYRQTPVNHHAAVTTHDPGVYISKWSVDGPFVSHEYDEITWYSGATLKYFRRADLEMKAPESTSSAFSTATTFYNESRIEGTISWHVPSGLTTSSCDIDSCTVTPTRCGSGNINFEIETDSDCDSVTFTSRDRAVTFLGPPDSSSINIDALPLCEEEDGDLCVDETNCVYAHYVGCGGSILEYDWDFPGSWDNTGSYSGGAGQYVTPESSGSSTVKVRVRNSYGWSGWHSQGDVTTDYCAGGGGR